MASVKNIYFFVPGDPVGKGRPRMTRAGHPYTPEKTRDYERLVRACFRERYPDWTPFTDAVEIEITAFYRIPKHVSKAVRASMASGKTKPLKTPDVDNISKIITDALNGFAYRDDAQIVREGVAKMYTPSEDSVDGVGVVVHLSFLEEDKE